MHRANGAGLIALALSACGCTESKPAATTVVRQEPREVRQPAYAGRSPSNVAPKNFAFTAAFPASAPAFRPIPLPRIPGGAAVWGATGRDHRGRVYFGVSCDGVPEPSAHLFEYDPETGTVADRGGVREQLVRLGKAKPGAGQNKIHTKIWQAADGFLYFASADEAGENDDGSKLPNAGSHLWRVKPDGGDWEHLAAVPEGVIAAAVGGRFAFFLAYYGHVLYRYDTATGDVARVRVGAPGGHSSRNFVADDRGHVYVPRVTADGASLVEYDAELVEVKATPLADYSTTPDATSHGLVGVAALADGAWAVATDRGRAYRIDPRATGAAVTDLGYLHSDGPGYFPCLFSPDGRQLVALGYRDVHRREYEWVTFDPAKKLGQALAVAPPVPGDGWDDLLLYGSITRDDAGRCVVAGRYARGGASIPVAFAVGP